MGDSIDDRLTMEVAILEAHVETSFVGDFGRCALRLAKCQVIIDGLVIIGNQLGDIGAFV